MTFFLQRNTKDEYYNFFCKQYPTFCFSYNENSKCGWVLSNSTMKKSTIQVSQKYTKSSKVIQQHCARNRGKCMMLFIENISLTGLTGAPMFHSICSFFIKGSKNSPDGNVSLIGMPLCLIPRCFISRICFQFRSVQTDLTLLKRENASKELLSCADYQSQEHEPQLLELETYSLCEYLMLFCTTVRCSEM